MSNTAPDRAPIVLTLDASRAALLMRITSAYSCADFQARFDYAMAELILWQGVHDAIYPVQDDSLLVTRAHDAHETITALIERSIKETLNE